MSKPNYDDLLAMARENIEETERAWSRVALAEEVVKAARVAHESHGVGGGPFSRPTTIPLAECSDRRCIALAALDAAKENVK